ncbi:MAG: hypothetical protein ACHP8A_01705 [Terriglobales bacterium]
MPTEMYARCEVLPGTFDSEWFVILGDISAVVDKNNVKVGHPDMKNGNRLMGSVLVYLVDENPLRLLVELPGQAVVGGLRTWIPRDALAA